MTVVMNQGGTTDVSLSPQTEASYPSVTNIVSTTPVEPDRALPMMIPAGQAYYWSIPWQEDVREAMDALRDGDYMDFNGGDDPNDVVRWLLSD